MSQKHRNRVNTRKRESGGYAPLSYCVIRSASFASLSPHAVKLVIDLLAQYNGNNNGDLTMAWTVMKKRGWRSRDTLAKARRALLDKDFIEVTRQGGRHRATLYGFTYYAIDECDGKLDVLPTMEPKSTWRLHNPAPPLKPVGVGKLGDTPTVRIADDIARQPCQSSQN